MGKKIVSSKPVVDGQYIAIKSESSDGGPPETSMALIDIDFKVHKEFTGPDATLEFRKELVALQRQVDDARRDDADAELLKRMSMGANPGQQYAAVHAAQKKIADQQKQLVDAEKARQEAERRAQAAEAGANTPKAEVPPKKLA